MMPRPRMQPRHGRHGRWNPPKALGNNIKWIPNGSTAPYTLLFYHNGQTTAQVNQLPAGVEHWQTYSIYHDEAVFWTVDYDACQSSIADGDEDTGDNNAESDEETEREDDEEEIERDTWAPLTFSSADNDEYPYMSFAGRRQGNRRLLTQRPDQLWAEQLLPDRYQAAQENRTGHRNYGGLVGDLPLLIGLMAMTVPAQNIVTHLPQMIVNRWRVYPPAVVPRQAGCKQRCNLAFCPEYRADGIRD